MSYKFLKKCGLFVVPVTIALGVAILYQQKIYKMSRWSAFLYPDADREPSMKIDLGEFSSLSACKEMGDALRTKLALRESALLECGTECQFDSSLGIRRCEKSELVQSNIENGV